MLDKRGVRSDCSISMTSVDVCGPCASSLRHGTIPKFSLRNNMYRGRLPSDFADLTWIEEMVCSIYRNTAHVTRLFNSASPDQPTVLHGNTCAHEMNVISTVHILLRTPADINGMLSVVFVGPGRFDPSKSGDMFRVRKAKIWRFLMWLKSHNRLYMALKFDENIVNLYPDDGPLPGVGDATIHQ
ncbi:hypothetical protein DFP72DRAFT_756558, partial [Ephemerocybe angulata]